MVERDVLDQVAADVAARDGQRWLLDPIAFLRHGLRALGERVMQWVVLAMSFTLFSYAAWRGEPWPLVAAAIFTLMWALVAVWRERKRL